MIIDIFLPLSLVFIMFTLGLGLTTKDFVKVVREPKAFGVGVLNQMVILPAVAIVIVILIGLEKELAVGFMILACCPGGVTSNMITKLAKGDTALSISYTAVMSIVTVITLPIITGLSMEYFMGSEAPPINLLSLGFTMFFITAIPVGMGLLVHMKYKDFTESFEPVAGKLSTLMFIIIVAGALASEWDAFLNNLFTLGPAIIFLIFFMLLIGFNSSSWFGLGDKRAITVAIESGIQNATVGITVGNLILDNETGLSLLSLPSGVYGILMYLVCLPFVFWFIKKRHRS